MEHSRLLQRPGGLGPAATRLKPIGTLETQSPADYINTPETIEVVRATGLDNINRIQSQYQVDKGDYQRAAVGPTNYQEGNIMPSSQITGPAGYVQRDVRYPMRAADMSEGQYLVEESNNFNPELRAQYQLMTVLPEQNFYNVQDVSTSMLPQDYTMPDSLPLVLAGERFNRG